MSKTHDLANIAHRKAESALNDIGYLKKEVKETTLKMLVYERKTVVLARGFRFLGISITMIAIFFDNIAQWLQIGYASGMGGLELFVIVVGILIFLFGLFYEVV